MARRAKSQPITPQARDIALTIRQGERRGLTQREIATTLGINERTVRKIKSGQTSGKRTYTRLTSTPRGVRATPNAFNAEFVVGYDRNGEPIVASTNIIMPDVRTRTGGRRAPTPLDVFRLPDLQAVADAERRAMQRRYEAIVNRAATDGGTVRLRSIGTMRKRAHILRGRSAS